MKWENDHRSKFSNLSNLENGRKLLWQNQQQVGNHMTNARPL